MKTQITGYKFFKKGECKILTNSVCDERGFVFEEGKEISVNFDKEKEIEKTLPTWRKESEISHAVLERGIRFNQQPTCYQYFPYMHKELCEDIIFEVVTIDYWIHPKPYSRSMVYSEHVKVLRKLTKQEFEGIYLGWRSERIEAEKAKGYATEFNMDVTARQINSGFDKLFPEIKNDGVINVCYIGKPIFKNNMFDIDGCYRGNLKDWCDKNVSKIRIYNTPQGGKSTYYSKKDFCLSQSNDSDLLLAFPLNVSIRNT